MSRRIFIGNVGGGVFDARISRPGYDAYTADVNNKLHVSFAASRTHFGKQAEIGTIAATNSWVNFALAYAGAPGAIGALRRGSDTQYGTTDRSYEDFGTNTRERRGSTYCLVVEQGRIAATRPTLTGQAIVSGDSFNFFVVK